MEDGKTPVIKQCYFYCVFYKEEDPVECRPGGGYCYAEWEECPYGALYSE